MFRLSGIGVIKLITVLLKDSSAYLAIGRQAKLILDEKLILFI